MSAFHPAAGSGPRGDWNGACQPPLDAGPDIQCSMHRRQGASLMASAGVAHCQCGFAASKAGGALVVARAIAPKRTASPAQPGCTTAPFAAVSATLHGAAFVCTNQVQIWRSLAAAMACLLRRGYTLDCQTWAADCCWRHWLLPLSPHRPVSGVELE